MRREYQIKELRINGKVINKVIIDEHVDKHIDHIDDSLVLKIVTLLDGRDFTPIRNQDGFNYFATNINYESKCYKLVWLLENDYFYIGVITLFRDRRLE